MYNEEICYCSECGSANKKSAVVCENCESKINRGHSAFFYYLKSHIKDEFKDRAVDKIYSIIKNYLLSHIYGTVLTVSVITVAASALAVNYQPHIETVTEKRVAIQTVAETEEKEPFVFDEDDMAYLHHVATCYDSFADYLRDFDRYWDADDYYPSVASLYAEGNVDGYTYSGVHELYNNPIVIGKTTAEFGSGDFNDTRFLVDETVVSGENLKTEFGKKLQAEGFEVAEGDYYMVVYDRPVNWDNWSFETIPPSDTSEKLVYHMVFVQQDDVWYLAEDRLIERAGV